MSNKVTISSEQIKGSKSMKFKDIVSLVVSNHSATATTIKVNGVNRILPAVDVDLAIPIAPFCIEACGYSFDIDFSVKDAELVVIDYATPINLTKQC